MLFIHLCVLSLQSRKVQCPQWIPREEYLDGYADFMGWSHRQFRFLYNWTVGRPSIPALWHVPLLADTRLPILIFSHGLGAMRTTYSSFCCDMASHGFLVAAVEHR